MGLPGVVARGASRVLKSQRLLRLPSRWPPPRLGRGRTPDDRAADSQRPSRWQRLCTVRTRFHADLRRAPHPQHGARRGVHVGCVLRIVRGDAARSPLPARRRDSDRARGLAQCRARLGRIPSLAQTQRAGILRYHLIDRRQPRAHEYRTASLRHACTSLSVWHAAGWHLRVVRITHDANPSAHGRERGRDRERTVRLSVLHALRPADPRRRRE